jgi:RAB protein geranylgeranyltransferase component A
MVEDVVVVGPYVDCAYKEQPVQQVFNRRLCKTKSCDLYNTKLPKGSKYCSHCGAEVQLEKKIVNAQTSQDEFLAKVRAELAAINSPLVFPDKQLAKVVKATNHHFWHVKPQKLIKGSAHSDGVVHPVTQDRIASDIDTFKSMFQKEYTILVSAYGVENISLHWGVMVYLPLV